MLMSSSLVDLWFEVVSHDNQMEREIIRAWNLDIGEGNSPAQSCEDRRRLSSYYPLARGHVGQAAAPEKDVAANPFQTRTIRVS